MAEPTHLVAIDWGTSSLRGALMDGAGRVLDRVSAADGIMTVADRGFEAVFERSFGAWLDRRPGAAVLACGMIGSRQGWVEAPYVDSPAAIGDLTGAIVVADLARGGRIGFAPGVKALPDGGAPDVMRGEETQILGAARILGVADGIFVLPGTHSKWARLADGRIAGFRTFMTGELFGVLRRHSILGRLMPPEDEGAGRVAGEAFEDGVRTSLRGGAILNGLFSARTHGLFGTKPPDELPAYLSGLLIGEEIREALALGLAPGDAPVRLVCADELAALYARALAVASLEGLAVPGEVGFAGLHMLARAAGLI